MDFTRKSSDDTSPFNEAFSEIVDAGVKAHYDARPERNYLGGSRLGVECLRQLGYEYRGAAKDPEKEFSGKLYRIFDRGHDSEPRMVEYLRVSGFEILVERKDGSQFGFEAAKDRDTGEARIAGHIDGVIVAGPAQIGDVKMKYPCLWEHKCLGEKGWKDLKKKGIQISKPVYYTQTQVYMAYMQLDEVPCVFTAINANTQEIYVELVKPVAKAAQDAIDKGVKVIMADDPEDLPRVAAQETDFRCRFCDYHDRCWTGPASAQERAAVPMGNWFSGGQGEDQPK